MRRGVVLAALTVMMCAASGLCSGQPMRIVPRERLDSLANPVLASGVSMRFESERIDTGTICEDDAPKEYLFRWKNTGDSPIAVTAVRTSCGCAVAKYDKRPVKAGEEGVIRVVYDPKGHPGFFQRRITVYTQQETRPTAILELTGYATPSSCPAGAYPHAFGPLRLKQRQVTMNGSRRSVEAIEMLNAGERVLRPHVDAKLLPPYLRVSVVPQEMAPGGKADLEIAFDPAAVDGLLPERVPVIVEGINLPPGQRTVYVVFGRPQQD